MESDDDRLEMIKSLGGRLVRHDAGEFWAIYEDEFDDELGVDTSKPVMNCRTSDVASLKRGTLLEHADGPHKIQKPRPDGTGFTILVLSR